MRTQEQVLGIVEGLEKEYPLADCTLEYRKDYELLFSVRLAAQCTDERVNMITPALFERFPTLESEKESPAPLKCPPKVRQNQAGKLFKQPKGLAACE